MEDLTLPEPARTLLGRTRAILDAYVTPCTPDRSGWQIGGGTILAARWRHRESLDIDLLVHPQTETRFLHPEAAPELHRRLEAAGARKITFGRFSQILFEESRIEMLAADPRPRVGHQRAIVDGSEATVLASSQILTGKFGSLRLAGRDEKIHENVCRYRGQVPIREVWRARRATAAIRRVLGLGGTRETCGASNASSETRRS